jgi:ATP-dependent DNA ligase
MSGAIVIRASSTPWAHKLHSRAHDDQVFMYAFDLLELDGEDLRARRPEERKAMLAKLIARAARLMAFNTPSTSRATARRFLSTCAAWASRAS